jgi:hypothetical protein
LPPGNISLTASAAVVTPTITYRRDTNRREQTRLA